MSRPLPLRAFDRFRKWWRGPPADIQPVEVSDAPAAVNDEARPDNALRDALVVRELVAEPWYVDQVSIDGHRLIVAGWSMPIDGAPEPAEGWFSVNGRRFDATRYPLQRADVGKVFWQRAGAANSGFECEIGELPEPYPDGVLEIARVRPETPVVERGRDSWFKPDPALHT